MRCQPVSNSRVSRRSPLPFYADESVHRAADIPRLAGAFDGINIKLMKCGGLGEALRMIAVARALGMKVMLGCMIESSLGITAAAHLSPLVDTADLDGNLLIENDPFVGATVEAGRLVALEGIDLKCDREMHVVTDGKRVLPPPARTFLAFLRAHPLPAPPPA